MATRRRSRRTGDGIVFEEDGGDVHEGAWSRRRVV